jgi:23S rRNA (cytidine2498-2'-O)-methyltransferase
MVTSEFLYVLCQAGAEPTLKKEVARELPGFRFAFSRPGFVTFRKPETAPLLAPDFEARLVFARAYGLSLGKFAGADEALERALALARQARAVDGPRAVHLHVAGRERHPPGEEPRGEDLAPQVNPAAGRIAARLAEVPAGENPFTSSSSAPPAPGDWVFVLLVLEPGEPGGPAEEVWLGVHRHSGAHSPFAGGRPELELPAGAPSRAWLKIEEAIRWPGVPLRTGDVAVEVGAAPGGAAFALLKRGLKVYGVDPGDISLALPGFTHLKSPAAAALRANAGPMLPQSAQWLLLDMNSRPELALRELDPYVEKYRPSLLGVVLTLKLNDWGFAELIPTWLQRIRELGGGMASVRAAQLAFDRREFCVVALTRAGKQRG